MTRPRVLVFSSLLPLPIDRGDRNRLFHILQLLASTADVRLVAIDRDWEPRGKDETVLAPIDVRTIRVSAREVTAHGLWAAATGRPYLITRFALPKVRRFLREHVREFQPDVYWGYQAPSFPLALEAPQTRVILDIVDSPSRYVAMTRSAPDIAWPARLAMAAQWRIGEHERRAVAHCHAALINSSTDLTYLEELTGQPDKLVLFDNCVPRSFLATPWQPRADRAPQILFVGNLAYPPNVTAVRLIVNDILPRVRARVPEASLVVSGARGDALARELGGQPQVRFLGFVEDLPALYRDSSVMLVPVPLAHGKQYKLLESLAVGLPSVVSRISASVSGVTDRREALLGETPDEYADAVHRLLTDTALAATLSANGRAFIEAEHTWESKRGLLARLLAPGH